MTSLEQAHGLLNKLASEWQQPEEGRLDVLMDSGDLPAAAWRLRDAQWGYLAAITGLDTGSDLEVLYHFCADGAVLTLRLRCPYDEASVPSLCEVFPYASVFERELMEMFGIQVEGTPDTSRLFLPDDWPADVYPLRKAELEADNEHEAGKN